ncbi:hypothetical protein GVX81_07445 [[Haemophilus] felis]|uniref:Putative zinc-finger domain-containing protein n=1 Tax=[Haemophilus] felis TaxID=123822 RepID=A0A1T0AY30_9PAST|nr:hypothetical protein [[Haemophilus] felis]NBI40938.1 hypothetical protein [[Haemophilus] felis]NBI42974.1 hypothetical protein [[Haemophilus] felis]OOS02579.1 hypothetical protein B0188_08065 [[Haemophilus] felis]
MRYCQRITELVSQQQERKLSFVEQSAVKLHLLMCPSCKNFERNCQDLSKLMKEFAKEKDK